MRAPLFVAASLALALLAAGCTSKNNPCLPDAGPADAGTPDAGSTDAGDLDAGEADAGLTVDAGVVADGGELDAGDDFGELDAGMTPLPPTGGCTEGPEAPPELELSLDLTGRVQTAGGGTFTWGDAGNCQALVGRFVSAIGPTPSTQLGVDAGLVPFALDTDAGSVALVLQLDPAYSGANTYAAPRGELELGLGGDAGVLDFQPTLVGSGTSLVVRGDFSGSLTITDWGDVVGDVQSGTLSWTCTP